MIVLAIWLIIWFILNLFLIGLSLYIKFIQSNKYLSFIEWYATKTRCKYERRRNKKRGFLSFKKI